MPLTGDSHAEHLPPGPSEQLKDLNAASFIHLDLPVIDSEIFKDTFAIVLADKNIKTVIISAARESKIVPSLDNLPTRLKNTFNAFKHSGKKLYVFDDRPSFLFDSEKCKYAAKQIPLEVQRRPHEQAGNVPKTTKNGEIRGNKKAAQGGFFTGPCKSQRTLAKPDEKKRQIINLAFLFEYGVDDGDRTHDNRSHNPVLYQLSYAHHIACSKRPIRSTSLLSLTNTQRL